MPETNDSLVKRLRLPRWLALMIGVITILIRQLVPEVSYTLIIDSLVTQSQSGDRWSRCYVGIPAGKDRPFASVEGIVEIRYQDYKQVKAQWVRIELQKKEILPGGGPDNTFVDTLYLRSLWTATTDEYETLHAGEHPFSLRLSESIPPSVVLRQGAGISYQLVASVCIGKTTWYGNVKADILRVEETIVIDKHDLHSTWPVYNQHEVRQVTNSTGSTLSVERNCNCIAPGADISILAEIAHNELNTVVYRSLELSVLEVAVFRRPYIQRTKIPSQKWTEVIARSQMDGMILCMGGVRHKAELRCTVPGHHSTPTIRTARYIDVKYVLEVKAILATNKTFLQMELPIVMSNWRREISIEAVRRIGSAQGLMSDLVPKETSYAAPRLLNPPACHTLQSNSRRSFNLPLYENYPPKTTVDHEIVYPGARSAARRIQRHPVKADRETRRLYMEAQDAVMRATSGLSSPLISVNDSQSPSSLATLTTGRPKIYDNASGSSLTGSEPGFSQLNDEIMREEDSIEANHDQYDKTATNPLTITEVVPSVPRRPTLVDLTGLISREDNVAKGGGGFADVYKGLLTDHEQVQTHVAIKVIRSHIYAEKSRNKLLKRLHREIRVWSVLQHPNVLPLLGTSMDFGPYAAMVCPWMQDGSLNHFLEKFTLSCSQRFDILSDICDGLAYLHSRAIIHGDLTSANVLMGNGRAYLCDFGLSSIMAEFQVTSLMTSTVKPGTCRWSAPELFNVETEDETQSAMTKACDIYSFGCIALQVISGHRPYEHIQRDAVVVVEIIKGHLPSRPSEPLLNDNCWEFINSCWRKNPAERPDTALVAQQLHVVRLSYPEEFLSCTLEAENG